MHFIDTDAHNRQYRPPDLADGRDAAARFVGQGQAKRLVEDNPRMLLGL